MTLSLTRRAAFMTAAGPGMQVTKPDYAPFMAKAKPAIDKLFAELWSVTTADEIANVR